MCQDTSQQLVELLCHTRIDDFNKARETMEAPSIRGASLEGVDLRGMNARGLDMRDCHLRRADLRGLDLSQTLLAGASICGAKISGVLFPTEFSAEEINLSLVHGTRLRPRPKDG